MEIELVTTKKKITKSIVKQLNLATIADFNFIASTNTKGFYVRDIGKNYGDNVGIFNGVNGYVRFNILNWEKYSTNGKNFRVSVKNMTKNFNSEEEADLWISSYNIAKEKCLSNHVII